MSCIGKIYTFSHLLYDDERWCHRDMSWSFVALIGSLVAQRNNRMTLISHFMCFCYKFQETGDINNPDDIIVTQSRVCFSDVTKLLQETGHQKITSTHQFLLVSNIMKAKTPQGQDKYFIYCIWVNIWFKARNSETVLPLAEVWHIQNKAAHSTWQRKVKTFCAYKRQWIIKNVTCKTRISEVMTRPGNQTFASCWWSCKCWLGVKQTVL